MHFDSAIAEMALCYAISKEKTITLNPSGSGHEALLRPWLVLLYRAYRIKLFMKVSHTCQQESRIEA